MVELAEMSSLKLYWQEKYPQASVGLSVIRRRWPTSWRR